MIHRHVTAVGARILRGAAVVCVLADLTSVSWAGGFTLTSIGGQRCGMQANLGHPDGPTALVHNPAGLADQPGVQLYLFVSPAFIDLGLEMQALDPRRFPEINPRGCGVEGGPACPWPIANDGYYTHKIRLERSFGVLPYLGVTTDLGFISPRARSVVLSLAIHAPNFYGAYFPEDAPSAYSFIGGMFLVSAATVGGGLRINRFISVGANLSYHYMYLSMAQKLSPTNLLTPQGQQPDGMATLAQMVLGDIRLDYAGTDHGMGWGASVLLTPVHWFSIGLGYSGATPARFSGDVDLRSLGIEDADPRTELRKIAGALGYKLPRRLTVEMAIPPALMAGVNVAIGRRFELGVDMRIWLYNLYHRQTISPIYDSDEKGSEAITEDSLSRDKNYVVSYQLSVGAMGRPFRRLPIEFMAGAGYDLSPIPDSTLTLDNPSLSQVKLSVGLRWHVNPHVRVSTAYMVVMYLPRDVTNSKNHPPTNIRGSGLSHSPALSLNYRF